nr:MAG TPA: hypothetical protein [Caudoviricetes sp.]
MFCEACENISLHKQTIFLTELQVILDCNPVSFNDNLMKTYLEHLV